MKRTEELRAELEQVRTRRERLFSEVSNLRSREDEEGVAQRIAETNRAIEKADVEIASLESEYGRMSYLENQAGDRRHLEGETPAEDREQRVQHRRVNEHV